MNDRKTPVTVRSTMRGRVVYISKTKTTALNVKYKTIKIQVNRGFDFDIITFNAFFENNSKHSVDDETLNQKVLARRARVSVYQVFLFSEG